MGRDRDLRHPRVLQRLGHVNTLLRPLVKAFGYVLPVVNWLFFLVGLAGAVGTATGQLPPFNHSWWAKTTTILLWLLFAREGYEPIAEEPDEHAPDNGCPPSPDRASIRR